MTDMTKRPNETGATGADAREELACGQVWELPFDAPGLLGWVVAATRKAGGAALVVPLDDEALDGEASNGAGLGRVDASGDRAVALIGTVRPLRSSTDTALGIASDTALGIDSDIDTDIDPDLPSDDSRSACDVSRDAPVVLADRAVLRAGYARWVAREDLWFRTPLVLAPAHARELAADAERLGAAADRSGAVRPAGAAHEEPALHSAVQLERWLARERVAAVLATGAAMDERDDGAFADASAAAMAAASGDVLGDLVAEGGPEAAAFEVRWQNDARGLDELRWTLELERGEFALDCSARPERLVRLGAKGGRTFVHGSPRLVGGWRSMWLPVEPEGERLVFERAGGLVEVRWSWPS